MDEEPKAPEGYVTIKRAAELLRCSQDRVLRAVTRGEIRSFSINQHVRFALEEDLPKLGRVRSSGPGDGRRAVMLRPDHDRYDRWEQAAGDRPVSTWLSELADCASGVCRTD